MKRRGLYFIIGGFFYIGICLLFCTKMLVYAEELEDQAEEVTEDIDEYYGYISSVEEDPEDNDQVLRDTIGPIKEEGLTKGTRSMPVNSYDPTVSWLFDQTFFYSASTVTFAKNGGGYVQSACYWILYDTFDEDTEDLINDFCTSNGLTAFELKFGYCIPEYADLASGLLNYNKQNAETFVSNNGWVQNNNNIGWWVPDPDPSPTPDPDPTPTPDPDPTPTPTPEGDIIVNIDPEFKIMVIFVGGMISGLLVGRMLLGFVK